MKKLNKKLMASLLAAVMAVSFMPAAAFADEAGGSEGAQDAAAAAEKTVKTEGITKVKAAKAASVYVTINNKGVIAKDNKGKIMADRKVTVSDINKDGRLTYDEAMLAAHKAYNKKSGFAMSGTWVTKLWNVGTSNTLFVCNGKTSMETVDNILVKKNDRLYASVNADDTNYADWYTYFDSSSRSVYANREVTLNLKGFQGMAGGDAVAVKDAQIGTWSKGEFKPMKSVRTDESGNATFKFSKKGTYYVTAKAEVADKSWSGADIKAPTMAPVCKFTVKAAKAAKPIKVCVTISNRGTIAKTKTGTIMSDKSVTVTDLNKDGKISYDEAMVAAHKKYNKKSGYATSQGPYGTQVDKLWNVKSGIGYGFNKNDEATGIVSEEYVKANDKLYAFIYKDTENWSDKYATFDMNSVSTKRAKAVSLVITGHDWNGSSKLSGIQLGTWSKGRFAPVSGAVTDEEGVATVSFAKKGTYYVTACSSESTVIQPPVCKITVK